MGASVSIKKKRSSSFNLELEKPRETHPVIAGM
jgi:hypothetical protein